MASLSRRKRTRINLLCTKCGRQFEDWACFVSIEIADSVGTLEWMPDNDATMGTNQVSRLWIRSHCGRPPLTNRKGRDAGVKLHAGFRESENTGSLVSEKTP